MMNEMKETVLCDSIDDNPTVVTEPLLNNHHNTVVLPEKK